MRWILCTAFVAATYLLNSCGTREWKKNMNIAPTFSNIRDKILKPRCESCHPKLVQYSGVKNGLIVSGNADASELYLEVKSGKMPPSGSKLTQEELTAIKTWINQGALND